MSNIFKRVILSGILFLCFYSCVYCQHKNCFEDNKSDNVCSHFIYLDELKSAEKFGTTTDTVYLSDNSTYYLRAYIRTCIGDMYIERRFCSNDKLVFSGSYLGVDMPDTVTVYGKDPVTGKVRIEKSTQYHPIKNGVWKFYDKQGSLLRKEEYSNGKLIN
jgi:hypothetical protein